MPAASQLWYPQMPGALPAWWTGAPVAGGADTLPSGTSPTYNPAYGGVPTVPAPTSTASGAITGNVSNLADLYRLGTGLTGISAADAAQQLQANLPRYQGMIGQSSANTQALLRGQIPADVLAQLSRAGAERGVSIGSPNSPNAMASTLGAILGTSLGLQRQGEQNLTGAIARTPTGPAFNPATMLVSPQDQQAWSYLARVLGQAPIPAAAAAANLNALRSGVGYGQGAVGPGWGSAALPPPAPSPAAPTGASGFPAYPPNVPTGSNPYSNPQDWEDVGGGTFVNVYTGQVISTSSTQAGGAPEPPTSTANAQGWVDMGDGTSYNIDTGETMQNNWQTGEQLPPEQAPAFPFQGLDTSGDFYG